MNALGDWLSSLVAPARGYEAPSAWLASPDGALSPGTRVYRKPTGGGSLMKAQWHVSLPEIGPYSEDEHFAPLLWMLEGMIAVNYHLIRWSLRRATEGRGIPIPPVYASGVRYEEDPAGREDWRDCLQAMKRGRADCDQLVGWRTAELRVANIPAEPAIKWQHIPKEIACRIRKPDDTLAYPPEMVPDDGLWLVHCSVKHPNGFIEDISKNLGMGGGYTGVV